MTTPTTSIPADGFGDLIVWRDEIDHVQVQRADPLIRLDAQMLEGIRVARPPFATLAGDVLTWIPTTGPRVIYRIDWTDFDSASNSYRAQWPD